MKVTATTDAPRSTAADTVAVGVFEGEDVAHDHDGALTALLDSGEAKRSFKHLALARTDDSKRTLLIGLGKRDAFDAERARVAAATVLTRARELNTQTLAWEVPHDVSDAVVEGIVAGTLLSAYDFTAYKSAPKNGDDDTPKGPAELIVSAHHDVSAPAARATTIATAQNAARDLQNAPANAMTPTRLAQRAQELAAELDHLTVETEGRDGILARKMGAFAAVAQGTYEEPQLITLRYAHPDATAPRLGYVGKAVTFDTGGISIKPGAKMSEMKFDMSGGAAVIEAVGAIARLGLPLDIVAVVGATENMPSGRSVKPGDIVTASNGRTIEVNNTDAEGRLVLADCLVHAVNEGAERLLDVATLTGAIIIALGSTHAGLMSNDDAWAQQVLDAAATSGELAWRLPLHDEYADIIKGQYGDLNNAPEVRKASSITAAHFLENFTDGTPWAHLDIAGTAWDIGRAYASKGGSGAPLRLLVELATAHCRN